MFPISDYLLSWSGLPPMPSPNLLKLKVPALVLAFAIIAAFAVKTDAQVKIWKNSETLFKHVIAVDPRGGLPYLGLGMAYGRAGKKCRGKRKLRPRTGL